MKTLYRCENCYDYSLHDGLCEKCDGKKAHPYPARFSLVKERKFRQLLQRTRKD